MSSAAVPEVVAIAAVVVAVVLGYTVVRRRDLGTPADRATFNTLHTASLASPALRAGLNQAGAERSVRYLRQLLGAAAVALVDRSELLASDSVSHSHCERAIEHAQRTLAEGTTVILRGRDVGCDLPECGVRAGVVAPVVDGDLVIGALVAYSRGSSAMLVRAVEEVTRWVSGQVELASADAQRTRLMEAELRALRAQISPHFVYNSLSAIASFIRTDPERARELLLEFADFSRYALRRGGEFTTLADELRNTERYLVLEQARFGERLRVSLRVSPEVLPIAVPFLVVQPLVENAVRHGLDSDVAVVRVAITAMDGVTDAIISVEDDGAGADPEAIRVALGESPPDGAGHESVGLANVDSRLRQLYGDRYGLVIETAPRAGTKVTFRVPKFAPGVRAEPAVDH